MDGLNTLLKMAIRFENDVVLVRQYSRQIAELLGLDAQDQVRVATSTSELARNAFQYAGGGLVTFSVKDDMPQRLHMCIQDQGKGIEALDEILSGSYVSKTGMGLGIKGARRLMDAFHVTSTGEGTTITFEKKLPKLRELKQSDIDAIARRLSFQLPQDSLQEIQRQNQELIAALDEVEKQRIALAQLNQELEETNRGVVALYAELDERANYLKQASEIKNQFFSSMTHEFRTPLNSILSLSQMLLARMDGELTEEQEKQVNFIYSGAQTLSDLVNDVLDLAKIEAGKIVVYPTSFEIGEMFRMLRGMLKPLIGNISTVKLVFEAEEDLPLMVSDEAKVSQILRNFISNGLKYTEEGEVRIKAERYKERIIFSVQDTGIGIDEQDQSHIFEDFTQVQGNHQIKIKGTGLGLPLSRRLAHMLGGEIRLKSAMGQGSTFFLSLPIAYDKERHTAVLGAALQETSVLIIDDNPADRYIIRHLLKPAIGDIIEASNGKEGLILAAKMQPSLIVLDFVMPDLTGAQVIKKLKRLKTTCDIPVIIQTSKQFDLKERNFLLSMAASIIPKSDVTQNLLLKEITRILQDRHQDYQKDLFYV